MALRSSHSCFELLELSRCPFLLYFRKFLISFFLSIRDRFCFFDPWIFEFWFRELVASAYFWFFGYLHYLLILLGERICHYTYQISVFYHSLDRLWNLQLFNFANSESVFGFLHRFSFGSNILTTATLALHSLSSPFIIIILIVDNIIRYQSSDIQSFWHQVAWILCWETFYVFSILLFCW